jgi:progressive ankylosis protein
VLYCVGMPLASISMRRIFKTWWPLAASWLLMGAELPVITAVMARMANPTISLAAYGGVVFPLALIIEAPIIMLLAASTALSKDIDSYHLVRRFMMAAGAILTAFHLIVAFTPLYYLVVVGLIGAPAEIVEPARIGFIILTPWTWSIAYRRFNQGVLIRFGHSETVGIGTLIRLSADAAVLIIGYAIGGIPGIVVGACAVSAGVISEAFYSGIVVRPVVKRQLRSAPPLSQPLTWRAFFNFYIPLAMNSLIFLLSQPIGSAAISRMPNPLASLAVWPVVSGLVFMFRSPGMAYNEVVVALMDQPRSYTNLRRFTNWLALLTFLALLLVVVTPISTWWFVRVSALSPGLAELARISLWLALPLPVMSVFQSWYQGSLLHGRRTRGITEAVVVYLVSIAILLVAGVAWGQFVGLYVGMAAMSVSMTLQTIWLGLRSHPILRAVRARDTAVLPTLEAALDEVVAGYNLPAD